MTRQSWWIIWNNEFDIKFPSSHFKNSLIIILNFRTNLKCCYVYYLNLIRWSEYPTYLIIFPLQKLIHRQSCVFWNFLRSYVDFNPLLKSYEIPVFLKVRLPFNEILIILIIFLFDLIPQSLKFHESSKLSLNYFDLIITQHISGKLLSCKISFYPCLNMCCSPVFWVISNKEFMLEILNDILFIKNAIK